MAPLISASGSRFPWAWRSASSEAKTASAGFQTRAFPTGVDCPPFQSTIGAEKFHDQIQWCKIFSRQCQRRKYTETPARRKASVRPLSRVARGRWQPTRPVTSSTLVRPVRRRLTSRPPKSGSVFP